MTVGRRAVICNCNSGRFQQGKLIELLIGCSWHVYLVLILIFNFNFNWHKASVTPNSANIAAYQAEFWSFETINKFLKSCYKKIIPVKSRLKSCSLYLDTPDLVAVVQKFSICCSWTVTAYTMTVGRKAVICNCNSGRFQQGKLIQLLIGCSWHVYLVADEKKVNKFYLIFILVDP